MKSFGICLQINCLFFELGLISYEQGLMIFHKMSSRTHHNYL